MKFLSLILATVFARPGTCPSSFPVVQNFDVNSYSGTWFEIIRDVTSPGQTGGRCTQAIYRPNGPAGIAATNRAIYAPKTTFFELELEAECLNGESRCELAMKGQPLP